MIRTVEIRHAHLFCGLGGGARGFNKGQARIGKLQARFRCLGGIDVDAAALRDFARLAGVPGTLLDLFSREQYTAFHGREPPASWREATPADIQAAFGFERPHIIFLSAPCKGFSGLLAEKQSRAPKYQALNQLTLRGVWLALEAFKDDPVEFFIFENVPRIMTRGRHLLDPIEALFRSYGYAIVETTHDCGELGGLGQSRKRFLMVARHREKVPPFLYVPAKQRLKGVGEVLDKLPLPGLCDADGAPIGGPMHRMPALQWRTWVRLAFVEAGKDWRSLNRLAVENGVLRDYGIAPDAEWYNGAYGVNRWDETAGTVTTKNQPSSGAQAVADPRIDGHPKSVQLGVRRWTDTAPVITSKMLAGGGPNSVADPRIEGRTPFSQAYRIVEWARRAPAVTAARGALAAVADPRPGFTRGGRTGYATQGHYGILPWNAPCGGVTGSGQHDNGRWSVADPRNCANPQTERECLSTLPPADERTVCCIRALDGTWHRPITTLEMAALQSLVEPEEYLELDGLSDSAWRERIGNAVPPDSAAAIASVMGRALLQTWSGITFVLSSEPIWVQPIALALSIDGQAA